MEFYTVTYAFMDVRSKKSLHRYKNEMILKDLTSMKCLDAFYI